MRKSGFTTDRLVRELCSVRSRKKKMTFDPPRAVCFEIHNTNQVGKQLEVGRVNRVTSEELELSLSPHAVEKYDGELWPSAHFRSSLCAVAVVKLRKARPTNAPVRNLAVVQYSSTTHICVTFERRTAVCFTRNIGTDALRRHLRFLGIYFLAGMDRIVQYDAPTVCLTLSFCSLFFSSAGSTGKTTSVTKPSMNPAIPAGASLPPPRLISVLDDGDVCNFRTGLLQYHSWQSEDPDGRVNEVRVDSASSEARMMVLEY